MVFVFHLKDSGSDPFFVVGPILMRNPNSVESVFCIVGRIMKGCSVYCAKPGFNSAF